MLFIWLNAAKIIAKKDITFRPLRTWLSEHKGYINSIFPNKAVGIHFNKPGHSIHTLTITILEQVNKNNESYGKEREKYHIN